MRRHTPVCALDDALPGCDTGPAGRLTFVLREARAAWRRRRATSTTSSDHDDLPPEGTR